MSPLPPEHSDAAEAAQPLGVLATLVSPDGGRDRLAAALADLGLASADEPGTWQFTVGEVLDSPGRFCVFERYADAAAASAHRGSEAMVRFRAALVDLGIRPELQFLALLDHAAAPAGAAASRRLLVITGGHRVALEEFFGAVSAVCAERRWVWSHVTQPDAQGWLRPEHAGTWDAVLLHDIPGLRLKRGVTPEAVAPDHETAAALAALLDHGQGLVVLHHALSAWPAWEGWAEAIGGRFLYAPGDLRGEQMPASGYRMARHSVQVVDRNHPVTAGVSDFAVDDELYFAPVLDDRVHPLLRSDADFSGELFQDTYDEVSHGSSTGVTCEGRGTGSNLVGWTTVAGRSPVVYLQPGDGPSTFADPMWRTLLGNAIDHVASSEAHRAAAAEPFPVPLP